MSRRGLLALLVVFLLASAWGLVPEGSGGATQPPSGSLSVSFIDAGQSDGVLVQTGSESYLFDAGRPEGGPNVVDFLRSRGVGSLDGIMVATPVSERRPTLALVTRSAGDVHVYDCRRCSVTISAAGGLEAVEFVQCPVEAALDRGLVAGQLGKSVRAVRVADES